MKLVNNQYEIEKDDILNNSEITNTDLTDVYGEKMEFHLKVASRKVYSIMYTVYGGKERERQYKVMRYMINNSKDMQRGIREAIIEYIRGALVSGMDLKDYLPSASIEERKENLASYPPMVKNILEENGLWIKRQILYQDEDIEWYASLVIHAIN